MRRFILLGCVCLALTFSSGCFWNTRVVDGVRPVLPVPERPELVIPDDVGDSPEMTVMLDNLIRTTQHIRALEEIMKAYNENATEHNEVVRRSLGLDRKSFMDKILDKFRRDNTTETEPLEVPSLPRGLFSPPLDTSPPAPPAPEPTPRNLARG